MRKINSRNTLKQVYIIGDGHTEKIYFEQLKSTENIQNLNVKPELPASTGYKKIFEKARNYIKDDDKCNVYCLIDLDKVLEENKLDRFYKDLVSISKHKQICVLINNPCFEFWFLCHYEKRASSFKNCEAVEVEVAKYINDYCKRQEYLRKKQIYSHLKPNLLSKAIPHSEFLEIERDDKSETYPRSEVYKLLKVLLNIPEKPKKKK